MKESKKSNSYEIYKLYHRHTFLYKKTNYYSQGKKSYGLAFFDCVYYKFITFTFLTKQSIIQKFKEVELQVLRFFDVFYLLRKVLHARFCKKKSIKNITKKSKNP